MTVGTNSFRTRIYCGLVFPPNLTLRFIIAALRDETVKRPRGYSHWSGQRSLLQEQVSILRNGVLISEWVQPSFSLLSINCLCHITPFTLLRCSFSRRPFPGAKNLLVKFPTSGSIRNKSLFYVNHPVFGTLLQLHKPDQDRLFVDSHIRTRPLEWTLLQYGCL